MEARERVLTDASIGIREMQVAATTRSWRREAEKTPRWGTEIALTKSDSPIHSLLTHRPAPLPLELGGEPAVGIGQVNPSARGDCVKKI